MLQDDILLMTSQTVLIHEAEFYDIASLVTSSLLSNLSYLTCFTPLTTFLNTVQDKA